MKINEEIIKKTRSMRKRKRR